MNCLFSEVYVEDLKSNFDIFVHWGLQISNYHLSGRHSIRLLYYAKAKLRRMELLWNVSCRWVPQIAYYLCSFQPIWPIFAWADLLVFTSLSGLREERNKYSIAQLGYMSIRAESGTQQQLKWHRAVRTNNITQSTTRAGIFQRFPSQL